MSNRVQNALPPPSRGGSLRRGRGRGPTPARLAWRAITIAARRRCPACGEGRIWTDGFSLRERCTECGLPPDRGEPDYFLGAYLFNLIAAELLVALLMIVLVVATWPTPPWRVVLYGAGALAVVAPVITYPFATTLWLAVDMIFRPPGQER